MTTTLDNTVPNISITGNQELNCAVSAITLVANSSVESGSYLWSTGETTASIVVDTPGEYNVTVTNANGCSNSTSVNVNKLISNISVVEVTESHSDLVCNDTNGKLKVLASGGYAPYSYSIDNVNFDNSSGEFTGLQAGIYKVYVKDANGCGLDTPLEIEIKYNCTYAVDDEISTNMNVSVTGNVLSNDYDEEGDVQIVTTTTVTSSEGVSVIINPTTGDFNYTPPVDFVGTDSFEYTICDNGNPQACNSATVVITVNQIDCSSLNAIATVSHVNCYNENNGSIDLTVEGGLAPFTFLWNNGLTTEDITGIGAGNYTVTITDANGCSITKNISINQPTSALSVSISNTIAPTCVNLSDGSATIVAAGGTAPYSYLWSNSQTTATAINLAAGTYSVKVVDANGCEVTIAVVIAQGTTPQNLTGNSIDLCISEVQFDLKSLLTAGYVAGGTWTDVNNSGGLSGDLFDPSIVNLGDYEFIYTEPGSCGNNITVYVNVNDDCIVLPCSTEGTIEISKVVTANDDGVNDVFTISDVASCGFTAEVQIFNRWGKMVYKSENYQNNWKGYHDNSGLTIGSNNKLPAGTYYYIVKIIGSGYKPITGYIYLGTN